MLYGSAGHFHWEKEWERSECEPTLIQSTFDKSICSMEQRSRSIRNEGSSCNTLQLNATQQFWDHAKQLNTARRKPNIFSTWSSHPALPSPIVHSAEKVTW